MSNQYYQNSDTPQPQFVKPNLIMSQHINISSVPHNNNSQQAQICAPQQLYCQILPKQNIHHNIGQQSHKKQPIQQQSIAKNTEKIISQQLDKKQNQKPGLQVSKISKGISLDPQFIDGMYHCPFCDKKDTIQYRMNHHIEKCIKDPKHSEAQIKQILKKKQEQKGIKICQYCHKIYEKQENYKNHIQKCYERPDKNILDQKSIGGITKKALKKPENMNIESKMLFGSNKFDHKRMMNKDSRKKLKLGEVRCPFCLKVFKNTMYLTDHIYDQCRKNPNSQNKILSTRKKVHAFQDSEEYDSGKEIPQLSKIGQQDVQQKQQSAVSDQQVQQQESPSKAEQRRKKQRKKQKKLKKFQEKKLKKKRAEQLRRFIGPNSANYWQFDQLAHKQDTQSEAVQSGEFIHEPIQIIQDFSTWNENLEHLISQNKRIIEAFQQIKREVEVINIQSKLVISHKVIDENKDFIFDVIREKLILSLDRPEIELMEEADIENISIEALKQIDFEKIIIQEMNKLTEKKKQIEKARQQAQRVKKLQLQMEIPKKGQIIKQQFDYCDPQISRRTRIRNKVA